ncbi:uncharacterized protein N0V89_007782 [Didymosphaeria variabile]|uniref:Uncharacterized protein n=1 Tax=Didymosphaeria variabile TaxID=1932322 RepID=A0A9W9C9T6_9PLEO|nr:uncharacterized protein N0V89_007782 [Didymosphaeria variabile]KAJ4352434.1 hypothetical protein N0V89_007782 [Didymosphaeria variabile]
MGQAHNLRKLQDSIVMRSYPSEQNGENARSNSTWCIDAQLLWDLLIYERAGRFGADTDKTLFGDSIIVKSDQSEKEDVAEFAMVGCAGISGHKTVPVEVIADAPDESETFPLLDYSATPTPVMQNGLEANTDFVFGSAGDMNHFMDQSNILLQEDFGKAIGGWINFNAM